MATFFDRANAPEFRIICGNPVLRIATIRKARFALIEMVDGTPRSVLSTTDKYVFRRLMYFLDDQTLRCWPSIETLAARCECSEKTVKRSLARLKQAGFLEWMRRTVKSGRQSNSYKFSFGLVGWNDLYRPRAGEVPVKRVPDRERNADGSFKPKAEAETLIGAASVVQAESEAASLDDAPKAQEAVAVSVSPALRGWIACDRPRALVPLPVGRSSVADLIGRLGGG